MAIDSILKALESHNIVFLYAPTGSGKSLINLEVAMRSGGAYITTPQTLLVNQYDTDLKGKFANMGHAVMGRKNYPCPYTIKLKEISDLRLPLGIHLVKGIRSRSSPTRELSLTAALAPCTSDSPSFVGNIEALLKVARERTSGQGRVRKEEAMTKMAKAEMARECPFWNDDERSCPYYTARDRAMKDSVAVTTFHYFEYGVVNGIRRSEKDAATKHADGVGSESYEPSFEWDPSSGGETASKTAWKRRNLLIIDEAHNLPDFLVNFYTVQASSRWPRFDFNAFLKEVEKAGHDNPGDISSKTFEVFRKWFMGYYEQEEKWLGTLKENKKKLDVLSRISAGGIAPTVKIKQIRYGREGSVEDERPVEYGLEDIDDDIRKETELLYSLSFRKMTLEADVQWIYCPPSPSLEESEAFLPEDDGGGELSVSWKPYDPAPLLNSLWSLFPKVVFSSATFLNIPTFLNRLGLDPSGASVVTVPSTFPPGKAPIRFPLNAHLSKSFLDPENRPSLMVVVREIERIAREHPGAKGVIHFPSYEWFRAVFEKLSEDVRERAMIHTPGTRNERLSEFKSSKEASIMFAIKMEEGTDFPDEQARWQIIVKTPYQDLGDEWIRLHKDKMGQRWYDLSALQQIIQASGRIVRSKDDWGETYILDMNALKLINRYRGECPDWFLKRLDSPA